MTTNVTNIFIKNISNKPKDKITETLSKYTERKIKKDKSVTYTEFPTTYFLENDKWNIAFFGDIEQFKDQVESYKSTMKNIKFTFNNKNLNKEMKFIVYNKLFSDECRLQTVLICHNQCIRRLAKFINEKYPNINSFKELKLEKANLQWIHWLDMNGIKTKRRNNETSKLCGIDYFIKTNHAKFLENVINWFNQLTDEREEWEKDKWDVRNLNKYGITYNKSGAHYFIDFSKINNIKIREELKKYIKQRLIANNKFSFSTASSYLKQLFPFINYICELEPTWNDFKDLERHHIEMYIEWLNIYTKKNLNRKNSNPKGYISSSLNRIQNFLSDIQIREYAIAPMKNVNTLIFPEDKPKVHKKSMYQIDYVPDFVLEQLFDNINNLHKEVVPVVYIMVKTGLRISDVLGLK